MFCKTFLPELNVKHTFFRQRFSFLREFTSKRKPTHFSILSGEYCVRTDTIFRTFVHSLQLFSGQLSESCNALPAIKVVI